MTVKNVAGSAAATTAAVDVDVLPGHAAIAGVDPASAIVVQFGAGSFATTEYATRQASYDVINRPLPVILYDVRGGRTGSFTLVSLTTTAAAAVRALFATGAPVRFLAHPNAELAGMWFAATRVSEGRVGKLGETVRVLSIDYAEVDAPS